MRRENNFFRESKDLSSGRATEYVKYFIVDL